MANFVFTSSDIEFKKIINYYSLYEEKSRNKTIIFFARKNNSTISLYISNKVVIAGSNIDDILIELSRLLNRDFIFKNDLYSIDSIGSDEVGTGALFGPITVCACFIKKNDFPFLIDLNVMDSKKISDEKIINIAEKIIKKIPYSLLILDNKKFNELTANGYNMNKIKALMHNKTYLNLIEKIGFKPSIVQDQFCSEKNYYSYLENEKNVVKDIIFMEKGESYYYSIASASIIARYRFIIEMKKISNEVGINLNLGAGSKANDDLINLYKKIGYDKLYKYVKMNFKNLEVLK